MTWGLTDDGFVKPTLAEIKAEIEAEWRKIFGNDFDLSPESFAGHFIATQAEREMLLWEMGESLFNAINPDTATGKALDNIVGLNALTRRGATKSVVVMALEGTSDTYVPISTKFSSLTTGYVFESLEAVTLSDGADEQQKISFSGVPTSGSWYIKILGVSVGPLAYNATAATIQTAIRAADASLTDITVTGNYADGFIVTYAGSQGKRPQELLEVSGSLYCSGSLVTVVVTTEIDGEYQATVTCEATETGALAAPAGTITSIDTLVSGLDSCYNPEDAVLGSDEESDEDLRKRRRDKINASVIGTSGGIKAAILALNDTEMPTLITACYVIENDTMETDGDMPPKSVKVVVDYAGAPIDSVEAKIAQAIYASKPAGIALIGDVEYTITGDDGNPYVVKWSRPTEVPIYIVLENVKSENGDLTDNEKAALKEYIASKGNALGVGVNVVPYGRNGISSWLDGWTGAVIVDYAILVGKTSNPTGDDPIEIEQYERAVFDESRIDIQTTV